MIKEGSISIQNLLLGFGILSYFIIGCNVIYHPITDWIRDNVLMYCICFYICINAVIFILYQGEDYQIAIRASFIGTVAGIGVIVSVICPTSYKPFGWYLIILSLFHFSEYFTTCLTNPNTLSLDSFLLNHSVAYWVAAAASWVEFFLEVWFFASMKALWYISVVGVILCVFGETMRKLAMITASTNFNHIVQVSKHNDHELVTRGVYALSRHPSYVGWFWWSIGTQIVLINPVCIIVYALASWNFFHKRIQYEEMTLIQFFGQNYLDYKKKVGTGLPFIYGYQVNQHYQ